MKHFLFVLTTACCFFSATILHAGVIPVVAGESIQKAIDAAPAGSVIQIAAGVFPESLKIDKPITLQGAGWTQTDIKPLAKSVYHTDADKIAFATHLEAATNPRQQWRLITQYLGQQTAPTIIIQNAHGVTLRNLKIQGISPGKNPDSGTESIVQFDHAKGTIEDCAILGPSNNGIDITNGSNAQVRHSLIAAVWWTGIAILPGDPSGDPSRAAISNSDIRNCYYAEVVIRGEGTTIGHCRISGAAWHGIRYDNCSPTITNNCIFANARSGIYASGQTRATIRGNLFYKNEMDAISCWFNNDDIIEANTIAANLREGIAVLGSSKPLIAHNVFSENPVAIECNAIGGQGNAAGEPRLISNWFWRNGIVITRSAKPEPAPAGSTTDDPDFADAGKQDYSLNPDSPARQAGAGAVDIFATTDPWPLQPEEQNIIPSSPTRDYSQWRNKPQAVR